MFKIMTKKRREQEEELKREREFQARINLNKRLKKMKRTVEKLDDFKKDYIKKAKEAALVDNKQMYNLAKNGLKSCLTKQRFLEYMIGNFEMSLQNTDMNKVVAEFIDGINIMSADLQQVTKEADISNAMKAYDQAIVKNQGQYEALDAFFEQASQSIEEANDFSNQITDEEIDKLIQNEAIDAENEFDSQIDSQISELKDEMSERI